MRKIILLLILVSMLCVSSCNDFDGIMQPASSAGSYLPFTYSKQTSSSKTFLIQDGQLNHYRQRPAIINEHVETARMTQSIVNSTNIVGQIFRASQDNINSITLTIQSAQGQVFDDFEQYNTSADLQVSWDETDPGDPAELETVIVAPGDSTQSMMLPGDASVNDEWSRSFPPTDFSDYIGEFDFYATHVYSTVKIKVIIEDSSGDTSSIDVVQQEALSWEHIEIDINSLTADAVTPADLTDIIRIGFRLSDSRNNAAFYIDNMVSVPPPGSIQLELWDMGTELPISNVTTLVNGTQYVELGDRGLNSGTIHSSVMLDLVGGRRQYTVRRFVAGTALEIPGNTLLNISNYYAIVLRYTDTEVEVYGANAAYSTDYYKSGYAFTTHSNSTPITMIGTYNDIQFAVFSTQDVYINTFLKFYDAEPGSLATETVYIEDKNMNIENVIAGENTPQQTLLVEFRDRYFYFPKGGKFEVNHNDDFTDDTTQITILIGYMFEQQEVYG